MLGTIGRMVEGVAKGNVRGTPLTLKPNANLNNAEAFVNQLFASIYQPTTQRSSEHAASGAQTITVSTLLIEKSKSRMHALLAQMGAPR